VRAGEIYFADLPDPVGHEQGGSRPVLVISSDAWLRSNPPVVHVMAIGRTRRGSPTHIEIEADEHNGLDETSYVRCEDLTAISPHRLVTHLGFASMVVTAQVQHVLTRVINPNGS
jgi:mRNA interferase MazF